MAKPSKYRRVSSQSLKPAQMIGFIIRGVLVSLCISLLFTLLFSLATLVSDNTYINQYTHYIMVAVNIVSIFIGSVYACRQTQSRVLIVGISVGILYVVLSVLIGIQLSGDSVSLSVLSNKVLTGMAAGALGGVIGLNLS